MFFDAHSDTATVSYENKCGWFDGQLTYESLIKAKPGIQTFAFFMDPDLYDVRDLNRYLTIIDYWKEQLESKNVIQCFCYSDFDKVETNNQLGAFLSLEGMDFMDYPNEDFFKNEMDDYEKLNKAFNLFHDRGIRMASFTWNHSNKLACGIGTYDTFGNDLGDTGLTELGKKAVSIMNKKGIAIDVSHASIKTFYDIIEVSDKPIIATHSNSKQLCSNRRNLSDDQLRVLAANNGVVGINLFPPFLSEADKHTNDVVDEMDQSQVKACVDDIVKHIEYVARFIGLDHVGLGCDFDGVGVLPIEIKGFSDMTLVAERLDKLGYSKCEIEGVFGRNLIKYFKNVLN